MPGGDFSGAGSAIQMVAGEGSYIWGSTAQVVSDVQGWVQNPATNFGWVFLGNESATTTAKRFDSREHPDLSSRPVLAVDFTPPHTCSLDLDFAAGTLTLGFELRTPAPVTWNLRLVVGNSVVSLLSVALPAIPTPVAFDVPVAGFPPLAGVGFLNTLHGPAGIVCSDFEVISTLPP